jgi:uncharacterized protein
MKLDLSEIATHLSKRIGYAIDEAPLKELEEGMKSIAPIKGEVVFNNVGKHIVARGHFNTQIEVECARCLGPYLMDIDLPIEEELQISEQTELSEDYIEEDLPEDSKEPLFEDFVLNLTELLRQSIIVAVPIKPLCEETCKGLCPQCGKNLNEEQCDCTPEAVNAAFANLAALLEVDTESS